MNKKIVKESQNCLTYQLDGKTIEEAISRFKDMLVHEPSDPLLASKIRHLKDYDGDSYHLYIISHRYETEAEKNKRIERERQQEKNRADLERAEFERLKKKYGE